MLFGFGPFELDLATCELRRDGRSVPVQPRVFGILRYLVEHRDRVVGKQELIDVLWGGHQLNAVAVPWTINRARRALGQDTKDNGFIQTIRGHGYRFVGELQRVDKESAPPPDGSAPPPEAAQHRMEEPFVGRERVMTQLAAALDAAGEGHGALYLLSGEAGIGKTRCANELALLVRRRGLQVWLGRCFEHGVAPAFWPFIQVLRAACNDASLHELARRDGEALLAELVPRGGDAAGTLEDRTSTGDIRFWLLDRLSRWLCRSGRSQPRVVVLDDLHSADESSLQALALLSPLLTHSRLLVVATARDRVGADTPSAGPGLATRLRPCEHVPLTSLQRDDVEAYLTAALGAELARRLARALRDRTAGNPLFVREVTRVMRAKRERDGDSAIADAQLPPAVRDLFQARLLALDGQARGLLDAACVIGEELTLPVLQRTTGLPAAAVLSGLQAAVLANIVEPRPDVRKHAFVHPLMREVLYAALTTVQRVHLHAAVGLALETLSLIEPRLDELAYHFHLAPAEPYYERAARYGRLAGDAAMRVLAYDEAVRFYGWALEAQPHVDPGNVAAACELLICSARALLLAGRRGDSRKQCERAIELARDARLPELLALAVRPLRPSIWFAQVPDPIAVHALQDALALLPETAVALRAQVYSQLASFPPYSLRVELGRQTSEQAVRLAREVNAPSVLLEALRARLFSLSGPDSIDELLSVTEEIVRLDAQPKGSTWSSDAQLARYQALMRRGDRAGAERALDAFARIACELRMRPVAWHADRLRAQRLLQAGKLDEAERRFNELWVEAKRLREPFAPVFYRAQMYALNLERTGKRLSASFRERPDERSWARNLPGARTQRVLFAIEADELGTARREFHALAEQRFEAVTGDSNGLSSLAQLALVAVTLSEHDDAVVLRALLEPYAELNAINGLHFSIGCVARYLAVIERMLGEPARAREYCETAIAVNTRTGHELERLRACLELAEVLADSRSSGERLRAHALAAEVHATAQGYGALALCRAAKQLDARLAASGIRSPAVSSRPARPQRRGGATNS
jgi:DNA-binding winged helix-turn-helix (wHTH) protein